MPGSRSEFGIMSDVAGALKAATEAVKEDRVVELTRMICGAPTPDGKEGAVAEIVAEALDRPGIELHLMELVRDLLPPGVVRSDELRFVGDGVEVLAAGRVIRRQHPSGKAIFLTLEDEYGHIPIAMFRDTYKRLRHAIREPVLLVWGKVSRREGTMNIMLTHAEPVRASVGPLPVSKDWR